MIYEKELFINKNNPYLFNRNIKEYDMKEAGFSIIREYKLLSNSKINELSKMSKEERNIKIGKLSINDAELKFGLQNGFKEARRMFFEKNGLETNDVISIKKDAIFTNKSVKYCDFGDYIKFRQKNEYTSYLYMGKTLEFYYNPTKLDVKGINDKKILLHENYMLDIIKKFFNKSETRSADIIIDWLRRFVDRYKRKELNIGYYRTLDARSIFEVYTNDNLLYFDKYMQKDIEDVMIDYNYLNILVQLFKVHI